MHMAAQNNSSCTLWHHPYEKPLCELPQIGWVRKREISQHIVFCKANRDQPGLLPPCWESYQWLRCSFPGLCWLYISSRMNESAKCWNDRAILGISRYTLHPPHIQNWRAGKVYTDMQPAQLYNSCQLQFLSYVNLETFSKFWWNLGWSHIFTHA